MRNIQEYGAYLLEARGTMESSMTAVLGPGYWYGDRFFCESWAWLKPASARILQDCGFQPLRIGGRLNTLYVDLYGEGSEHDQEMPTWSDAAVRKWAAAAAKRPMNFRVMARWIWFWNAASKNERVVGSRDQGIGRHLSVHVTKAYRKTYRIKGLDTLFPGGKQLLEDLIRKHGMFKRDELTFDWEAGVLGVGGTWVDVHD